jgi:hypothetical protein
MATLVPDMFGNFYLAKNHKIDKNSTTTKAREKISTDLESLEFQKFFDVCLTKFKNNLILLYKIGHRFLLTTKLFIGWVSGLVTYSHLQL